MKAGLQKGEKIVDGKLITLKWQDKRPVVIRTSIHDDYCHQAMMDQGSTRWGGGDTNALSTLTVQPVHVRS